MRTQLIALRILLLLLAATILPAGAAGRPAVTVEAVVIPVTDLDRSVQFYREVLDFQPAGETEVAGEPYERLYGVFGLRLRVARLRLGGEHIELQEFLAPRGRSYPESTRSNDGWFQHIAIIVSDMDQAYAHLRSHRVTHASAGPQRLPDWNAQAGGIEAFYFRDPDGNHLEVLRFPPGKGDPRWQVSRAGQVFLGIDHTAIVVMDTGRSLNYYRDGLGLAVAGASENHGPEQERLNNVFGARLRITALRGDAGPGIELLEYLAPRTGRPMPRDTAANDLWSWQVRIRSGDLGGTLQGLAEAGFGPAWTVPLPGGEFGATAGARRQDPDGHSLLLFPARESGSCGSLPC